MKVILKETIESLGIIGTEVNVADGYARNYLLPQGKAVKATPQNRRVLEQQKAQFDLQIAKEKALAEEMAKRLEGVACTVKAKVADADRLYGSVTVRDIINALAKQEIVVEKRVVLLKEPIKTLGSFSVPIRVYADVEPEITVHVEPEEDNA
ncbi:MAG: 50S ribosomal protein L9 [Desulfobacterales bacterium]|nr:50S ribosomal protein L9 [Desulfobacterales bacterium]MDJ0875128.1 50S ribosomal protein L9 [Desulfobacterales bacterium]MDJ0883971.1 50S ribosomal protein L9 [Desulfobacterales bacterium]